MQLRSIVLKLHMSTLSRIEFSGGKHAQLGPLELGTTVEVRVT